MRIPLIAGNWKMNLGIEGSVELAKELQKSIGDVADRDMIVIPSFTTLSDVHKTLKDSNILLGAQHVGRAEKGAYTGEISAGMLKEVGCTWVLAGHSERRHIYHEDNDLINGELAHALGEGMHVILCVGETEFEREQEKTEEIVAEHIELGLKGIEDPSNVVIAYEPVWAIGSGKTATPGQIQEVHAFIRTLLRDIYNEKISSKARIIYGGSVTPENIAGIMSLEDVDGVLVGGASLEAKSFSEIVYFKEQ